MSELNVINYTILCNCNCNWSILILCCCNLLKLLPNCILNYRRAYNLFWVSTATKLLRSSVKSFSDLYKLTQVLLLFPVVFVSGLHWGRGGDWADRPPKKPEKVTLFTVILYNSENNIRDQVHLLSIVLSQQCCEVYTSSQTVAKPLRGLTTKYRLTEISPLTSLVGSAPTMRCAVSLFALQHLFWSFSLCVSLP